LRTLSSRGMSMCGTFASLLKLLLSDLHGNPEIVGNEE